MPETTAHRLLHEQLHDRRGCVRRTEHPTFDVGQVAPASAGAKSGPAAERAAAYPPRRLRQLVGFVGGGVMLQRIHIRNVEDRRRRGTKHPWLLRWTVDGKNSSKSFETKAEANYASVAAHRLFRILSKRSEGRLTLHIHLVT